MPEESNNQRVTEKAETEDQRAETVNDQTAQTRDEQRTDTGNEQRSESVNEQTAQTTNEQRVQTGTEQRAERGIHQITQTENEQRAELGSEQRLQVGNEQRAETENDQRAETVNDQTVEMRDEQRTDTGNEQRSETGNEQTAQTGNVQRAELGSEQRLQAGNEQRAETENDQRAETVNNQTAQTRDEQRTDTGNEQRSETGNEQTAQTENVQRAELGSEQRSQEGNEQRTETGIDQAPQTENEQTTQVGNVQRTETGSELRSRAGSEQRVRIVTEQREGVTGLRGQKQEAADNQQAKSQGVLVAQPTRQPTSNYEAAFELTGHGKFNILGLVACSLIFIHAVLEMIGIAYIITPAECDLRMTVFEKSMINSAIFIGIFKTAICWGAASDRFGRRKLIVPTVVGAAISSFISSLCMNFWPMFIFRLITGYMISGSSVTVLVYLGEIYTQAYRDQAISIAVTSAQMAFIVLPGLAWIVIPGTWSINLGDFVIRPWRVFMWIWSLVGLSGAAILFVMPESPRFVLAAEGPFAAHPILAKIYSWNHDKPTSDYPVESITTPSPVLHSSHEGLGKILEDMFQLLKPPMLRCFILTHYCMFMVAFLCNGFYIWIPDFINEMLKDTSKGDSVCDLINSKYLGVKKNGSNKNATSHCSEGDVSTYLYPTAIVMEVICLIPFLTVIYLIDKHDKTKLYMYVLVACSVGLIMCSIVPQILIAMMFMIMGLSSASTASILSALAMEVFPTSLRALAMCTMFMAGHVGSTIGTSVLGAMAHFWCYVLFLLISFACLVSALTLVKFWPDAYAVRKEMEKRNFIY